MSPDREPTDAERKAAVRHHEKWCGYRSDYDCPLNDFDPLDQYLPEDLEAIRGWLVMSADPENTRDATSDSKELDRG